VDPAKINLMRVVVLFDSVDLFEDCIMGLGRCGDFEACPLHQRWKNPKVVMMHFLEETTLSDLAREAPEGRRKILEERMR